MKEFLMLFRHTPNPDMVIPEGDALQAEINKWQNWIGGIAAQGKFVKSNELDYQGKIVNAGKVVNGPYAEVKEIVGGYIIVKADNYDEAVEMAHGCPTLGYGGSVEVRAFTR